MKSKQLFIAILSGASVLMIQTSHAQSPSPTPAPVSGTSQVQGSRFGAGGPAERMERLAEALNLSVDQQAKIKAISRASRPQIKAIRDNATLSPEARHAQIKAIREANQTQIRAILTPEQQTKWDEMKAKRRAGRGKKQ